VGVRHAPGQNACLTDLRVQHTQQKVNNDKTQKKKHRTGCGLSDIWDTWVLCHISVASFVPFLPFCLLGWLGATLRLIT